MRWPFQAVGTVSVYPKAEISRCRAEGASDATQRTAKRDTIGQMCVALKADKTVHYHSRCIE